MQLSPTVRLAAALSVLTVLAVPARAAPEVTPAIEQLAQRAVTAGDARQRPFAVVDKRAATIAVYRNDGTLAGAAPVLLGRRSGDRSMPGVGQRTRAGTLRPDDLTTPAGRFESEPGRNLSGEAVVWVDYGAAFAIHRLRADASYAERVRRIASADTADRRASAGCVVVPAAFFDSVVQPLLGNSRGVVYVMPEEAGELIAPNELAAQGL